MRKITLLAVFAPMLYLLVAAGCKKEDKNATTGGGNPAGPSAAPAAAAGDMTTEVFNGVSFAYPKGWSTDKPDGSAGLDIKAPAPEAEVERWQPGVYLEVQSEPAADLEKAMTAALDNLRENKTGFLLVKKEVVSHPGGFKYGRVHYTNLSAEQVNPLTQWLVIIPMEGNKRVLVQAAALTESWPKYQPDFARVVDSIRPPK